MLASRNVGMLSILLLPTLVLGQTFTLQDNYVGDKFFSGFTWFTGPDPTHGQVDYVDMGTAQSMNLSYSTDTTFVMRADSTSVVGASDPGRKSVRISSKQTYTDSLVVLDVAHMPEGCATWPAFWTVVAKPNSWPVGGEIDIIEGVNTGTTNQATLHTSSGCSIPSGGQMSGTLIGGDCTSSGSNNNGCGITFTKPNSYGSALNSVGGGWYVMKRTNEDGVYIWFWARNDASVPAAVKSGSQTLSPDDSWGTPDARFPTTSCDWPSHFTEHTIVFDLTFCGDWAGATFSSTCGGDCKSFVNQNPSKFQDAYWTVNAVRAYVPGSGGSGSTSGVSKSSAPSGASSTSGSTTTSGAAQNPKQS